ncbi:MAG: DUF2312 domain-containing protein [Alphaproteobacteria bacterium]|nr:DUF2312 domain-containing protein [Alphaproteobacteria bacterium]
MDVEGLNDSVDSTGVARDRLKTFIERVERLEEEKKAITDDMKEIFAEAKGEGFDVKVIRMIIRIRKQDSNERAEQEAILDLYLHALGMADS